MVKDTGTELEKIDLIKGISEDQIQFFSSSMIKSREKSNLPTITCAYDMAYGKCQNQSISCTEEIV